MRLGGEIGFESRAGWGTLFFVDLPRAGARQDVGLAAKTAGSKGDGAGNLTMTQTMGD